MVWLAAGVTRNLALLEGEGIEKQKKAGWIRESLICLAEEDRALIL